MADMSFTLPGTEDSKRQAYRVAIPGLEVVSLSTGLTHKVRDLSASGLAFEAAPGYSSGQSLSVRLILHNKIYLENVEIKVVRCREDVVACSFLNLSFQQEAKLDKLILEVQKLLIARRKRQANEEDT